MSDRFNATFGAGGLGQRNKNSSASTISGVYASSKKSMFATESSKNANYSNTILNGMRYKHVGSRSGNASILDRDAIHDNVARHGREVSKARYRLAYVGDDGEIIKDAVYEKGGRLFGARPESTDGAKFAGTFNVVDAEALAYKKQLRDEANEYIDTLMNLVVDDDEALADVLDVEVADLENICPDGKGRDLIKNMPSSLVDYNCYPHYLDVLPADSKEYSAGIAKLRFILKSVPAVLDNATGTKKVIEANDEK
jgi:hypothetical protein